MGLFAGIGGVVGGSRNADPANSSYLYLFTVHELTTITLDGREKTLIPGMRYRVQRDKPEYQDQVEALIRYGKAWRIDE